ncbi:MAG: T9SS type A sorting domain-containing protein [Bacteroidales bacterium]|nr:T9SS type A sorting domain-containing protein [Bacteroidales bacterium]
MRKFYFALVLLLCNIVLLAQDEIIYIPDPNLKAYLRSNNRINTNGDNSIQKSEAEKCLRLNIDEMEILDLTGIEYFINLRYLNCSKNKLTGLDLTKCINLEDIDCSSNDLSSIDLSRCTNLEDLDCSSNNLPSINLSKCTNLKILDCSSNNLSSIDLSNKEELVRLNCSENRLTNLSLLKNKRLTKLDCFKNELSSLNILNNIELIWVNCSSNSISDIDISNNLKLQNFICSNNSISVLDVSKNLELKELNFSNNYFKNGIDLSENKKLRKLNCSSSNIPSLYLRYNELLSSLVCSDNGLTDLNISKNKFLYSLDCSMNNLSGLDLTENSNLGCLNCSSNKLEYLDVKKITELHDLNCSNNSLEKLCFTKFQRFSKFNCDRNKFTFSALKEMREKRYFHYRNPKKIYSEITKTINYCVDYSDEAKVHATSFSWYNAETNQKVDESFVKKIGDGVFKFLKAGTYYCILGNSHCVDGLASLQTNNIKIKQEQTIEWTLEQSVKINENIKLSAIASSGLPLVYKLISGPATLKNNILTPTAEGTIKLFITQAGNEDYNSAEKVVTLKVTKCEQTIIFNLQTTAKVNDTITLKATASTGADVTFELVSGEATLNEDVLIPSKEGEVVVKAVQAGNDEYSLVEKEVKVTVSKRTQTITFDPETTARVNDKIALKATASTGFDVAFELVSGKATIKENVLIPNKEGEVVVKAVQAGNDEFLSVEKEVTIVVSKRNQTITFGVKTIEMNTEVHLQAEVSSGLAVTYKLISGKATLKGNLLTSSKVGEIKIRISQAGNNEYLSAEKEVIINVTKRTQTITFNPETTAKVNDKITLKATASSGSDVTFELVWGKATIKENVLIPSKEGMVLVKAVQEGNDEYLSVEKEVTIVVSKRTQTITFNPETTAKVNDKIALKAIASTGFDVTFELVSGEATLKGDVLILSKEGEVVVKAVQAGNYEYSLVEKEMKVTVSKRTQTITFDPETTAKVNDKITLKATASTGFDVAFELVSGEATLKEGVLIPSKEGKVVVKAIQEGNKEYALVEKESTITVSKREQTITFDLADTVKVNTEIKLEAQASSGLEVAFELISGKATLDGNILRPTQEGELVVKAVQKGNDEYSLVEKQVTVIILREVGVNSLHKTEVNVYPNPVKDKLFIEFAKNNNCVISICSMQGEVLLLRKTDLQKEIIDISSIPSGVYIVRICDSRNAITYKIVKE